jgi:hypothetical protein
VALALLATTGCGGGDGQDVHTANGDAADGRSVWAALADGATTDEDGAGDGEGPAGEDGADDDDATGGDDDDTTSTTGRGRGSGQSGNGGGQGGGRTPSGSGGGTPGTTPPTSPPPTTPPAPPPTVPPGPHIYRPSLDATGRTDVSAAMNAFFNSVPNGSTVEIPPGTYRMEQTLLLAGRSNLTIRANGVLFTMTSRGDRDRDNVHIADSTGISLTGLSVRGANPQGGVLNDGAVEGQHGIEVNRSRNVTLTNVTATDTYADFFYVGGGDGNGPSENIILRGCRGARSGRQGISITNARNVLIEGCTLSEVRRTALNFEPNSRGGHVIDNVRFVGNTIGRTQLLFVSAEGTGPVNNILIQDNVLDGAEMSVWMRPQDGSYRSNWTIVNNRSNDVFGSQGGAVMLFENLRGLTLRGNTQPMQAGRNMYLASAVRVCLGAVDGNDLPNAVGVVRHISACR